MRQEKSQCAGSLADKQILDSPKTQSLQSNEEVHVSGKIYPLRLDFLAKKWKPIKHSIHKTVIFSINEEMFQQHHKGSFIASLLLKIQRGNET